MNRKGSIILHVLVTGVVVALIAACLLRLAMMSALLTERNASDAAAKRLDDAALAYVTYWWDHASYACPTLGTCFGPMSCASIAGKVTCAPAAVTPEPIACNCTCTLPGDAMFAGLTVTASAGGTAVAGACNLSILSPDQLSNQMSGNGAFTW